MADALRIKITGDSSEFRTDIDKNIKKMSEISDKSKDVQNKLNARNSEDFAKVLSEALEEVNKELDEANLKLQDTEDKFNRASEKAKDLFLNNADDDKQEKAFTAQQKAEEEMNKAKERVTQLEEKQASITAQTTEQYNAQTDDLKLQSAELQQQFDILNAINNQDMKNAKFASLTDFFSNAKDSVASLFDKVSGLASTLTKPMSGISSIFKKDTLKSASNSFAGMAGSVKNFTLALFGARTAFTLIRKAINEIMEDNQQLSNTISTIWNSIVSLIAPAVNAIVSTFATILNYVISIISFISSVDVLGLMNKAQKKANAKKVTGGGSSSKKKQEQQYSFDTAETIQKQDDTASGSAAIDKQNDSYLKQVKLNGDLLRYAEKLKAIWEDIKKIGSNLWNGIKDGLDYMDSGKRILQVGKDLLDAMLDDIKEMTGATVEWSANLDWGPLFDGLASILEELSPILQAFGDIFVWIYKDIILPLGKYLIEELGPAIENVIAPALSIIGAVIEGIKDGLEWMWETILQPLADEIGEIIVDVLDQISGYLEEIGNDEKFMSFMQTLGEVIGVVVAGFTAWAVASGLVKGAIGLLSAALNFLVSNPLVVAIALIALLADQFINAYKTSETFRDKVNSVVNAVLGFFEGMANGIIDAWNAIKHAMNTLHFDIPDWVPGIGGQSFGFDFSDTAHVSLPRLAKGAVIPPNKEFLAMLGDQTRGRNIEAPESLLREIVQEESGSQEINIVADGDIGELIKLLRLRLQKEDTRVGKSLVEGS